MHQIDVHHIEDIHLGGEKRDGITGPSLGEDPLEELLDILLSLPLDARRPNTGVLS